MPFLPTNQNSVTPVQTDAPAAEIFVGEIPIDDGEIAFQHSSTGIFEDYYIINRYEIDRHVFMMSVTSPVGFNGNTASFVQLGAPTMIWICDWTAEKTGEQPEAPTYETEDENAILLDAHFEPAQIIVKADTQTPRWRISGTYVYGFKDLNATMFYPRPPWVKDKFDRGVRSNLFIFDLKEYQNSSSSSVAEEAGEGGDGEAETSPGDSGSQNSPSAPDHKGSYAQN